MEYACPSCQSSLIKRNGHIHNGKQNHRCLECGRQFVLEPTQKLIDPTTRDLIKKSLLERVSLAGICRIFDVSMPWLLEFIDKLISQLPADLNAQVFDEDGIEVAACEVDELWGYVGSKANPQWLWLVVHSKSRQVLAMHVGARDKTSAEKLFAKLPEPLKKKPSSTLICSLCTTKPFLGLDTWELERAQVRQVPLKGLIAPLGSAAQD